MLSKKWFDKRAVEGGKWAVIAVHHAVNDSSKWDITWTKTYNACPLLNVPKLSAVKVLRNDLTKEEAMAMAKFLNFAEKTKGNV